MSSRKSPSLLFFVLERLVLAAIAGFLFGTVMSLYVKLRDPGPPGHWAREFDTLPDVVDGQTICVTGTLVEPDGFCTSSTISEQEGGEEK